MMFRRLLFLIFAAGLALGAQAAEPAMPDDFRLGVLDQIEVNVVSFPDLRTVTRVATDGSVTLPLVGEVKVAGMTRAAAANAIAARYAAGGYVKSPSVRIEITDYQSRKASVLGQVNTQGLITLDRNYTGAESIARAGGLGAEAGETAVVVRQLPDGKSQRITVNLAELTGGSAQTEALLPVLPGDVIFVPRAETFSVVGAVNRPGNFRLTTQISVQQALAAAGDVTLFGSKSGLKVRRKQPDSTTTTLVAVTLDDILQPGDVLVVRERGF